MAGLELHDPLIGQAMGNANANLAIEPVAPVQGQESPDNLREQPPLSSRKESDLESDTIQNWLCEVGVKKKNAAKYTKKLKNECYTLEDIVSLTESELEDFFDFCGMERSRFGKDDRDVVKKWLKKNQSNDKESEDCTENDPATARALQMALDHNLQHTSTDFWLIHNKKRKYSPERSSQKNVQERAKEFEKKENQLVVRKPHRQNHADPIDFIDEHIPPLVEDTIAGDKANAIKKHLADNIERDREALTYIKQLEQEINDLKLRGADGVYLQNNPNQNQLADASELQTLKEEKTQLEAQVKGLQTALEKQQEDHKKEINSLTTKLEESQEHHAKLVENISKLMKKSQSLADDGEKANQRNLDLETALRQLEEQSDNALRDEQRAHQNLKEGHQNLMKEHQNLWEEHQTLTEGHQKLVEGHQNLKGEHNNLKGEHNNLKKRCTELLQKLEEMAGELKDHQDAKEDADNHLAEYELSETFDEFISCCLSGDQAKADNLLDCHSTLIDRSSKNGTPVLISVAKSGTADMMEYLINQRADINAENSIGWTPLMWASWRGHTRMTKLLLDQRAAIDAQNKEDYSALMLACSNQQTDVVKLLIDNDADLGLQSKDDKTALRIAYELKGQLFKEFLKSAANQGKELRKQTIVTPLNVGNSFFGHSEESKGYEPANQNSKNNLGEDSEGTSKVMSFWNQLLLVAPELKGREVEYLLQDGSWNLEKIKEHCSEW